MRIDVNTQGGASHSMIKKISKFFVSFFETLGTQFGIEGNMYNIDWRTEEAYGSPPDLFTGDKSLIFDGGFDTEDPIILSGEGPEPCTVRAIIVETDFTG